MGHDVVVLGVFNADTAYRATRQPRIGETILGRSFALGAGGKGSNQAVAAARAGADTAIVTKLGDDAFGELALATWTEAGVTAHVTRHAESHTGAAFIFVDDRTGDNAIIVAPGAAATLSAADMDTRTAVLSGARILLVQLEQPVAAAHRALEIARNSGVLTILNPAPAADLPEGMLALCDYVTPNESEAAALTGLPVGTPEEAERAAAALIDQGAKAAIVTLGAAGALHHDGHRARLLAGRSAGPVVETTGAGDAFNGGLAAALAAGRAPPEAIDFANATAALSVTRAGAATSMPARAEIDALLARCPR